MPQQNAPMSGNASSSRQLTTLLACGWGIASAYILFNSLFVTHDARPCFAALVPLVIVWATLERKRWGRLALLGLSATALGLFLAAVGYLFAKVPIQNNLGLRENLAHLCKVALKLYGDDPTAACAVLVLAATTGLWLRRPAVVAEFERGKKATLAIAQRAIAMCLVGFWGITVVFTPLTPLLNTKITDTPKTKVDTVAPKRAARSNRSPKTGQNRKDSKQNRRSELPASNL